VFTCNSTVTSKHLLPGIDLKTLTWGERTLLAQFDIEENRRIPEHHHPYEQIGYLVAGRLQLTIGSETHTAEAGDSWCIPADTGHAAMALLPCVVIEVFSPVRTDYLP
jgi:quercetin dioxygenase-like cupin family protein